MSLTIRSEQGYLDRKKAKYVQLVNAVIAGESNFPPDTPWRDKLFQQCLVFVLRDTRRWREDAQKLAVIKEIFGK